jgi:transcriptional regulator with GAF, ATPase, and Fis domain
MPRPKATNDRPPAAAPTAAVLDLARELQQALSAGTTRDEVNELLAGALAALGHLVPFDLAAILELDGDELSVRVAQGRLDGEPVRRHRLKLSEFPAVREALARGRAVAFGEHDHKDGDGDPYDGVLDLPHGHHCMVVPLQARSATLGAMTFDRAECGTYPPAMVELAELFGRLLALAMSYGEQTTALTRLREQLLARERLLREHIEGPTTAGAKLTAAGSIAMRRVVELVRKVAPADLPVLITGETGTGKELCARAVHEWSPRAGQPLVSLNCAALPAGMVESELFGHVKGAFSGAAADRLGRFQLAHGGTLFLDEVGELPHELQAKLLRALQDGCFEPVGSDRTVKVDVRVVAATNSDLEAAVAAKRFREDLYWRLAVFPIGLPPLRERRDDIAGLAERHLAELAQRAGRTPLRLADAARRALAAAAWPGNVRELVNVLERAALLARDGVIEVEDLLLDRATPRERPAAAAPPAAAPAAPNGDAPTTLEDAERRHIEQTLARTGGRIYGDGGAAQLLAVPPSTLRSRMEKLGLGGARDFRKRGSPA